MSYTARYVSVMTAEIKPGWKKILFSPKLKPLLMKALQQVDDKLKSLGVSHDDIIKSGLGTYIRPNPCDIFRAFCYFEPDKLRAIIIGQDPYPKKKDATGLSFSVPRGVPVPASLRNIYNCLMHYGFLPNGPPDHGDLTAWASQGVLLLNRYLTRNCEIVDGVVKGNGGTTESCIHDFWGEFTNKLIKEIVDICATKSQYICIALWGKKADPVLDEINDAFTNGLIDVTSWGHPSPMNRSNGSNKPTDFKYCMSFTYINSCLIKNKLPPINWDPNSVYTDGDSNGDTDGDSNGDTDGDSKKFQKTEITPKIAPKIVNTKIVHTKKLNTNKRIVAFTDGGCSKNGKKGAKAAYGVYFPPSFMTRANPIVTKFCGLVQPLELVVSENFTIKPVGDTSPTVDTSPTTPKIAPTNNRAELLGIIYALSEIVCYFEKEDISPCPIVIITDTMYGMNTINSWIWKWHKKDNNFKSQKNPDLLKILYTLMGRIAFMYGVDPTRPYKILQPAALNQYKTKEELDISYNGLVIIHQNSHLKKDKQPAENPKIKGGGADYEKFMGNTEADNLCTWALEHMRSYERKIVV